MNLLQLDPLPENEERKARDAEARARFEADRDEDISNWRVVPQDRRKRGTGVTFVTSVRLQAKEIDELHRAAEARGMNPSEFIRAAALTVARAGHPEPGIEPRRELPATIEEAEAEITHAYERAIQEVRYIREVAERNYHAGTATSGATQETDAAQKDA